MSVFPDWTLSRGIAASFAVNDCTISLFNRQTGKSSFAKSGILDMIVKHLAETGQACWRQTGSQDKGSKCPQKRWIMGSFEVQNSLGRPAGRISMGLMILCRIEIFPNVVWRFPFTIFLDLAKRCDPNPSTKHGVHRKCSSYKFSHDLSNTCGTVSMLVTKKIYELPTKLAQEILRNATGTADFLQCNVVYTLQEHQLSLVRHFAVLYAI